MNAKKTLKNGSARTIRYYCSIITKYIGDKNNLYVLLKSFHTNENSYTQT